MPKFNLMDFMKAGTDIAAASYEGKLAAEQNAQKEQMLQIQQQRLLEQIAGQGERARLQQEGLGLRQDIFGLQQQNAALGEANRLRDDARDTSKEMQRAGNTEGAAEWNARSMGGTGQRAALNPNEQRQLLLQQWQQNPAQPMTALAAPENRAPESIPGRYPFPEQGGRAGGEIVAQPDVRKEAAVALHEFGTAATDWDKVANFLPPDKQERGKQLLSSTPTRATTPEEVQQIRQNQRELRTLMSGVLAQKAATEGQQQVSFLRAIAKQGLQVLDDPAAMRRLQHALAPSLDNLTDADLKGFAAGRAEELEKIAMQQLPMVSKMGPKAMGTWADNIKHLSRIKGTPVEITAEDIAGLNKQALAQIAHLGKADAHIQWTENFDERKFAWQRHVQQTHINRMSKDKRLSEVEKADLTDAQKRATTAQSEWQRFYTANRNALRSDFDPSLAYDPQTLEGQGSNLYMRVQAQQQRIDNILRRHGVDPEAETPTVEPVEAKPRTIPEKVPGSKIGPFQISPDVTINKPAPPRPPPRKLGPPAKVAPLKTAPVAAPPVATPTAAPSPRASAAVKATPHDVNVVRPWMHAGRFDELMRSPAMQDPVKRQAAKDAFKQISGHVWQGGAR